MLREIPRRRAISRSDTPWALSTWICIHCSFWSIASLCAQKADCTERWLRFTSREVAHYYFAPNKKMRSSSSGSNVCRSSCGREPAPALRPRL
ncbi:hypothetical protein A8F52_22240 [Burkholderia cenocepacia]|nr:hypothetical protein A8F49_35415 [Burkholderia cenocepacia]ONZ99789.1 hypothetical protein A8F52_22240 [Burkholderia cenocepacia]